MVGAISVFLASISPVSAAVSDAEIAKIKAAFLFNFVKFIQWPDDAFPAEESPIVIGVLGDESFGRIVTKTVGDAKIGGRRLIVPAFEFPDLERMDERRRQEALAAFRARLAQCHLVFLASSQFDRVRSILDLQVAPHLVVVGDGKRFAAEGAHLALERKGDRIVFFSNSASIEASPAKVSSKLLRLAKPVNGER